MNCERPSGKLIVRFAVGGVDERRVGGARSSRCLCRRLAPNLGDTVAGEVNGAVDGVALTANTTPTALPDLSATDLQLGYDYMGTVKTLRMWAQDIGDAGLVEATEPSLVPSLSLTFDGTENSFIVEDWSE